MTKIRVDKFEAARRQIDAAIRMLFDAEDPVAIHTLAMAGFRILRDLAEQRGESYMENVINSMIIPGKKAGFWGATNSFSNFLKHADRDPDGTSDGVDEKVNDAALAFACMYYQDLGHLMTPEMIAFMGWFSALHPEFIRKETGTALRTTAEAVSKSIKALPRHEQLAMGKQLLPTARAMSVRLAE